MSALGEMLAGLAHEINNPVSFISGNLPVLKTYVTSFLVAFRLCHEQTSWPPEGKTYEEIELNPSVITIHTAMFDEHQVQIQIEDNGCGMSQAAQERIFEQGFTTKAVGKGTGLGMAIAYQIITEQHGGEIKVQSEPGQGSTFTIWIPIKVTR